MKKILEIKEIHNGYLVFSYSNDEKLEKDSSFHWHEEAQLMEHILKKLGLRDKFAIISRKEWAVKQESISV